MRIATGAYRTSPITSILSECHMHPIDLRRKKLTLNYAIKLLHSPNNQAYPLLLKKVPEEYTKKPRLKKPFYFRAQKHLEDYGISCNNFHPNNATTKQPWTTQKEDFTPVTSPTLVSPRAGSEIVTTATATKKDSIGVAAILSSKEKILLKLPRWYGTQESIELLIIKTIESIDPEKQTTIFTDSIHLMISLKNKKHKNSNIKYITHLINKRNGTLTINYIDYTNPTLAPALNAAELACELIHNDKQCKMSNQLAMKKVTRKIQREWNKEWTSSSNKCPLKKIKNTVNDANPATKFNRREQIAITRLRIGHTPLTHEYLFNNSEPPICKNCNTLTNIEHILIHCTKYNIERQNCNLEENLSDILCNAKNCKKVINYINNTNLVNDIL